jgi:dipeptidyl aminopeptidase/acylaminoacyl peptidase
MNELSAFERRLAAGLEAYAGPRETVDADAIARAAADPLPLRRSIPLRFMAVVAPAPRLAWRPTAMVALLALALAASVVIVGSQPRRLPAVVVPAGNGLIAYSSDGDIYVGDPATGHTTAIVTGPEIDSLPVFSPDGSHIAFVRGVQWTASARLMVVRVGGGDEGGIVPAGFSDGSWSSFAWTPDSASILVSHDSAPLTPPSDHREATLFDASGAAEPRLLTPPLPIGAPIVWSPKADQILSGPITKVESGVAIPLRSEIDVWDADLERRWVLKPAVPGGEAFEPFRVWPVAWSPDGSTIMFGVGGSSYAPGTPIDGLYLMDADGSDVRRLPVPLRSRMLVWSPDGIRIADHRCSADPDRPGAVIVIVDLSSGTERTLDATAVRTKTEGQGPARGQDDGYCGYYAGPEGRSWDYEGWSWSPDGSSIVMLERNGTRPIVVDVETGQVTELPWEADSAPSWQRIFGTGPG